MMNSVWACTGLLAHKRPPNAVEGFEEGQEEGLQT